MFFIETFLRFVVKFLCCTARKAQPTSSDWENARKLVLRLDDLVDVEEKAGRKVHLTKYQQYVLDVACLIIKTKVEGAVGQFDVSPGTTAKWEAVERAGARSARGTRRWLTAPMVKF